jgi:hypothetical protein
MILFINDLDEQVSSRVRNFFQKGQERRKEYPIE